MESAARLSEFELSLVRSSNPLGTSILLILAWIAASDGEVDAAERQQLRQIAESSEHGPEIEALIRCVQRRYLGGLQLACEIVREHFPDARHRYSLRWQSAWQSLMACSDLPRISSCASSRT